MHVPWPRVWKLWQVLDAHFFGAIVLIKFVLKTRANSSASQYVASSQRSSPQAISHGFPSAHVHTSVSPPPHGTLPKLFPMVSLFTLSSLPSRPFPMEISPSYFPRFPFRPSVQLIFASILLLLNGALSKLFPTVSRPSSLSSLPSRSFSTKLSPSYFPRFPLRPPCRRFRPAPSQRRSLHAISHGFLSVHLVVASVSLLPNGALQKLFPMASPPSTLSSLPSRTRPFSTEL